MAEMRVPGTPVAIPILLLVESLLIVGACVPRPADLVGPSASVGATARVTGGSEPPSPVLPAGFTPIPSFVRPTPLPAPTFLAYAVKPGDTLTSIARVFRTTPRSIAFWSRAEHPSLDPESTSYQPDRLEIGWVLLVVPDAVFDEGELLDTTPSPEGSPPVDTESGPTASPTGG